MYSPGSHWFKCCTHAGGGMASLPNSSTHSRALRQRDPRLQACQRFWNFTAARRASNHSDGGLRDAYVMLASRSRNCREYADNACGIQFTIVPLSLSCSRSPPPPPNLNTSQQPAPGAGLAESQSDDAMTFGELQEAYVTRMCLLRNCWQRTPALALAADSTTSQCLFP